MRVRCSFRVNGGHRTTGVRHSVRSGPRCPTPAQSVETVRERFAHNKRHLRLDSACQDYSATKSLKFTACAWNDIQPRRCNCDMGSGVMSVPESSSIGR